MSSEVITAENKISLGPGELTFQTHECKIWMVLGSCLSIILHHPQSKYTAACHAQLPTNYQNSECTVGCPVQCFKRTSASNTSKYLNCAFKEMADQFKQRKIPLSELNAYIFGGSEILNFTAQKSIGQQNIDTVEEIIATFKLKVIEKDLGGSRGRTIMFDSETGTTSVKIQKNSLIAP